MPTTTSAPSSTAQPTAAPVAGNGEILFLRRQSLVALDPASGAERTVVEDASSFTATPDGSLIAFVRGEGPAAEVWTIRRDGSEETRHTDDDREDVVPSLARDGSAIVFASATGDKPYTRAWPDWSQWCAASEVRLIELSSGEMRVLGKGCDPAFAPDNKRIAFATPPTGAQGDFPSSLANTIRLVNRQGQNGWTFASADGGFSGEPGKGGMLVYAPSWSPDGGQVAYHRFLGYQALVDISMGEIAASFKGNGQPMFSGAGWEYPAHFAPGGARVAIVEDNYSDARGFGGYDNWSVTVVTLDGTRQIFMPSGQMDVLGSEAVTLDRAQGGAWSPDGEQLAVILPPGWKPGLPENEPVNDGEVAPGELWLWLPGSDPQQRLASEIDFASPVLWLPAS